ncbi:ornithine carbamoyltransferase [Planctomycetales bacterium]|nr:ornithine carbamoyltransferase [Planctomycetales bacterium]GHT01688.1 ornithine carbamoyltransferase [Planctomycetales bacterium]GHV23861.1 ornithine carbamoyltransferase [Planctomycetales bacterium]
MKKDFINILDFTRDELEQILATAQELKARKKAGVVETGMAGKTLALYFSKDSLRTRVSLEVAATSMGGAAVYLDFKGKPMFERESLPDQARVVGRLVDAVAIRTFSHQDVVDFARWCAVPVINALTDWTHPTQAMADILTMRECLGDTRGRHLVYIGDGNNVARSLAAICAKLEVKLTIAAPAGYKLGDDLVRIRREAGGGDLREVADPIEAVKTADVIYTDVWVSMGQENEEDKRLAAFAAYQVNRDLWRRAPDGAMVLHCLPAERGREITDEIIDDENVSRVFQQAENRMHIMRALMQEFVVNRGK